jgi:non-ribosomal peptide synthase protein (TIGR01720 family)
LLIVIHHLVIDGVSWRILLDDIQTAYGQLADEEEIQLPAKTTSFKEWAHRLREYAESEALKAEMQQWRRFSRARWKVSPLPLDSTEGPDIEKSARSVTSTLTEAETQKLLRELPQSLGADITALLLTALVRSFLGWTGKRSLLVDLESHGREVLMQDVDISRTVGWFTAIYPALLDLGASSDVAGQIAQVKTSVERMSSRGLTYGVLRYLTSGPGTRERLVQMPRPEVSFNYLGQFDQTSSGSTIFSLAREFAGSEASGSSRRPHLLGVTGRVVQGRLEVSFSYGENRHERRTIERLAEGYLEELRGLLRYAESSAGEGAAPAPKKELELSQNEMDNLLAELQGGGNS